MSQRVKKIILTPAAAAVNNICLSQTPGAGGALVLNGSTVAAGVATLDMPRRVAIISGGNLSGRTFVITGLAADGDNVITETLVGPNNATVTSLKNYLKVTSITIDAAAGAALTVGTNATAGAGLVCLSSGWVPLSMAGWGTGFDVIVTGVANYTVEITNDSIFTAALPQDVYHTPFPHPSIVGKTGNEIGSVDIPVYAIRLTVNSYTAGATLTFSVRPWSPSF